MDDSTQNVTVAAGFITDLLEYYQDIANTLGKGLFALTQDIDLSRPTNKVPIAVYNAMCEWIVGNLGPAGRTTEISYPGTQGHPDRTGGIIEKRHRR